MFLGFVAASSELQPRLVFVTLQYSGVNCDRPGVNRTMCETPHRGQPSAMRTPAVRGREGGLTETYYEKIVHQGGHLEHLECSL